MPPRPREYGDGLTDRQRRKLLLASLGLGGLLLAAVLGATAASHAFGVGGGFEGPPEAGFTIQTVERGGDLAVNVTHAGGQAASPGEVAVEVDGELRGNWSSLGGEGADVVAPGHSLTVEDVEPGDEVRVLWTGGEGDPVLLDRNTVESEPDG